MSYINDKIVNLRTERGWSEYELSKIANIRQSTISSWSTKDSIPSIPNLQKICDAFGITLAQFFAETNESYPITEKQHEFLQYFDLLSPQQQNSLLSFLKSLQKLDLGSM